VVVTVIVKTATEAATTTTAHTGNSRDTFQ